MTSPGIFERVSDVLLFSYTQAAMRGTDDVDTIELLHQVEQHFLQTVSVGGTDEYTQALEPLAPLLASANDHRVTDGVLESIRQVTNAVAQEAGSQLAKEIVALFLVIDFLVGRLTSLTGESKEDIARRLAR